MPARKNKSADDDELCGCDADFRNAELAADETLPPAVGGVAPQGEGEETDGCDLFFGGGLTTLDEDLPAATGGVE